MSSYLITGVSRGIGYEFIRQYSADPENIVIGLVRNKSETDKKISDDPDLKGRTNLHILEADLTDYGGLEKAVTDTVEITGGSLDYLIGNAGLVSSFDAYSPLGSLADKPKEITQNMRDLFEVNVIANVHLVNLFLPLIFKGQAQARKVIILSSGLADAAAAAEFDLTPWALYGASKAAMNLIVAKYSAQYKDDGILFLALSPGMVEVGHAKDATQEQLQSLGEMGAKFLKYAPDFKGPITPEQSVNAMRSVISDVSIEKGHGGDFLSHFGNKKFL